MHSHDVSNGAVPREEKKVNKETENLDGKKINMEETREIRTDGQSTLYTIDI